jgi:LPS-assembly lipoprotein
MNRYWLAIFTFFFIVISSGCGFHLRGNYQLPEGLKTLRLEAQSPYGPLANYLRTGLTSAQVKLAPNAPVTLSVSVPQLDKRAVSLTARSTTAEYQLRLSINYQLTGRNGAQIIPPSSLFVQRVYLYNENNIAASDKQEQLLIEDMKRDLADQLLTRITLVTQAQIDQAEQAVAHKKEQSAKPDIEQDNK